MDQLVDGVEGAAGLLAQMTESHPGAIHQMSVELCQEDGDQTRRMAATILANAFVFQEVLAGGEAELASVKTLEQMRGSPAGLTKSAILEEMAQDLKVNYWPIFDIACRMLR